MASPSLQLNNKNVMRGGKDDEDWRDSSESGRRLSSKRMQKLAELQADAEPTDKTPLLAVAGGFVGAVALGLAFALTNGKNSSKIYLKA